MLDAHVVIAIGDDKGDGQRLAAFDRMFLDHATDAETRIGRRLAGDNLAQSKQVRSCFPAGRRRSEPWPRRQRPGSGQTRMRRRLRVGVMRIFPDAVAGVSCVRADRQ